MHEVPGPPMTPLQLKLTKYIAFLESLVALSDKGTSAKNKSAATVQTRGLRNSLGRTTLRKSAGQSETMLQRKQPER